MVHDKSIKVHLRIFSLIHPNSLWKINYLLCWQSNVIKKKKIIVTYNNRYVNQVSSCSKLLIDHNNNALSFSSCTVHLFYTKLRRDLRSHLAPVIQPPHVPFFQWGHFNLVLLYLGAVPRLQQLRSQWRRRHHRILGHLLPRHRHRPDVILSSLQLLL